MKAKGILFLILLFLVTSFSYSQEHQETKGIPVSKEALANFKISQDEDIAVKQFKIKFPGFPTVLVDGNKLNEKALSFLKQSREGVYIQVFDIQYGIKDDKPLHATPIIFKLTN